jgi:hypothetical protein
VTGLRNSFSRLLLEYVFESVREGMSRYVEVRRAEKEYWRNDDCNTQEWENKRKRMRITRERGFKKKCRKGNKETKDLKMSKKRSGEQRMNLKKG